MEMLRDFIGRYPAVYSVRRGMVRNTPYDVEAKCALVHSQFWLMRLTITRQPLRCSLLLPTILTPSPYFMASFANDIRATLLQRGTSAKSNWYLN